MSIFKTTQKRFVTLEANKDQEFGFIKSNRLINNANLKSIEKSLAKYGQLSPIIVTQDGYIFDGQHRYLALKKLGMPIWYTISKEATKQLIEEVNTVGKHWVTQDRVHNQKESGYKDIKQLYEQYENWKQFTVGSINYAFSARNTTVSKDIKNKEYKFDFNKGKAVLETCLALSEITRGASLKAKAVKAIKQVLRKHPNMSIKRLCLQAKKYKINFTYNNESDIVKDIYEVYNKNLSKANRLNE